MNRVLRILSIVIASCSMSFAVHAVSSDEGGNDEGEHAFNKECGLCHQGFNMGVIMLERRLGKDKSELHKRNDLPAEYIKVIVRNGLRSMPALTRVDVTEEQLISIVQYLTRNNSKASTETE